MRQAAPEPRTEPGRGRAEPGAAAEAAGSASFPPGAAAPAPAWKPSPSTTSKPRRMTSWASNGEISLRWVEGKGSGFALWPSAFRLLSLVSRFLSLCRVPSDCQVLLIGYLNVSSSPVQPLKKQEMLFCCCVKHTSQSLALLSSEPAIFENSVLNTVANKQKYKTACSALSSFLWEDTLQCIWDLFGVPFLCLLPKIPVLKNGD